VGEILFDLRNFPKNACLFLEEIRNFPKNACLFLEEIRNFPKNACLFLTQIRKKSPEKRLFLIRTVSYERGTPVGLGLGVGGLRSRIEGVRLRVSISL
jgi:hypothetical protein